MTLTSDITLSNPIWDDAERKLKDEMGLFKRLVDIYIVACSIGIKDDKWIDDDSSSIIKTIGRNTYQSIGNTNLRDLLDYMLQNAILNSKKINYSNDERLKLAFDPDYASVGKLSPTNFLTGFANYGINQMMQNIKSDSPIVAINELYNYFNNLQESKYDDILKNITLDIGIKDK